ncbi:MAG: class D sortase [Firmicutes bacterium]|nr:class D sortase [Bacillota bacterium]
MASSAASFLIADDAPNFNPELVNVYDPEAVERNPVPIHTTLEDVQDGSAQPEKVEEYISIKDIEFPDAGQQYGHLGCERIGLDAPVYWYDSNEILAYGVGQSLASYMPGFGGVIILSAHNTTYFECLENIEEGDVIKFGTNYCNYEYKVTKVEVMHEKDLETYLFDAMGKDEEKLIMYTCWPFYAVSGRKYQRLTVTCERTVGLNVKWRNME